MERSPLVVVAAALVLAMALSPDAWANCNAIPDAESAMIGGYRESAEYDPMMAPPAPGTGPIGFKGALGRMDRIRSDSGTAQCLSHPAGRPVRATAERVASPFGTPPAGTRCPRRPGRFALSPGPWTTDPSRS